MMKVRDLENCIWIYQLTDKNSGCSQPGSGISDPYVHDDFQITLLMLSKQLQELEI